MSPFSMYISQKEKTFWSIALLLSVQFIFAQSPDVKVANEYFNKKDYEKAYDYYKKLIKDKSDQPFVYSSYIECVRKLDEEKAGLSILNKLQKEEPTNHLYTVDEIVLLREKGEESQSDKTYQRLVDEIKVNRVAVLQVANQMQLRQMNSGAVNLLKSSREALKSESAYGEEFISLYRNQGNKPELLNELLRLAVSDPGKIETVQNGIQIDFGSVKEREQVFTEIYRRLNTDSDLVYNELLVWMYLQEKDFYNAFIQQRAIDKQENRSRGLELIEIADIAVLNMDYKHAIRIYSYVTENYPTEYHYVETKRKMIHTKELLIKQTYPVDSSGIVEIIGDYDELIARSRRPDENARMRISQAELYAIYLQDNTQAKKMLAEVTTDLRQSKSIESQAKILLGDILVLEGLTGDAMLEYMQVERTMEDDELGHLAKLKTAKVSYYESEFELAQAHLNILKRATHRKIANDAQDLSLLIKSNLAMDTSAEALSTYAQAELLVFQKKYNSALETLDKLEKKFPNHTLEDEIHYQKAHIYKETNRYSQAAEEYQKVINYQKDILTDDALFELAELYQFYLKDQSKAKELYKKLLIEFTGSIYVEEARKRYYGLSGV